MLKYSKLYTIIGILFLFNSCSVTKTETSAKSSNFTPDIVEMHVTLDDYELIGEMEVEVEYSRYFGLFKIMEDINGEPANRHIIKSIQLYGDTWFKVSKGLKRALYKVHQDYPSGDLYVPVYRTIEKKKMFLGRRVKQTLKVKVYKTKS